MDFKKLNEELEKFVVNELDNTTMDNAFRGRFDSYLNSKDKNDWKKVTKHQELRQKRDKMINFMEDPSFKNLIGKDVSNEICEVRLGHFVNIYYLADKYCYPDRNLIEALKTLEGAPNTIKGTMHLSAEEAPNLVDMGSLKTIEGVLELGKMGKMNLVTLMVNGTLELSYNESYVVKNLPKFINLEYSACNVNFDEPIPEVKGDCIISYNSNKDFADCMVPKQIGGDLIIDFHKYAFKSLSSLQGLQIKGSIIIKEMNRKLNKRLYSELQRLNLLDKLQGKEELENEIKGIKPEPTKFEPDMMEYTREKDNVTFKVGDIVTCPSPGEFEITNIFFQGGQVWKGKLFYPNENPDVGHIASLENIKTKRQTAFSIDYLKKN